jgi:phosphonate metabolism protein (transferase hexapeptide repeat family)
MKDIPLRIGKAFARTILIETKRIGWRFRKSQINGEFCRRTKIGNHVFTHRESNILRCTIGNYCRVGRDCLLTDSEIGDYTLVSQGAMVNISKIGRFCGISHYSRIGAEEHPLNRVTAHEITYWPSFGFVKEVDETVYRRRWEKPTVIENDVFIGHAGIVMPGVRIGDGAIIGAGSVVTKDVEPYCIVAGVPAKIIRMRFEDDVIRCLMRIRWWEWSPKLIRSRISDFNDTKGFCEKYG